MNTSRAATIDVIIPVYNEAENIENNLDSIYANIQNLNGEISVVIIYDFEQDSTLPVIESIKSKYQKMSIRLIKNKKRGVCNAIKQGLSSSRGDYVLVTMADMSDDYSDLPELIELAKDNHDIVCASRYMKGGSIVGGSFIKKTLSRLAGVSLHLFGLPTHDATNSYKLYSKKVIESITIESDGGFEIGLELVVKAYLKGYTICELPTRWLDREKGSSKFQLLKWFSKYLKWYFVFIFSSKPHAESK